MAGEVQMLSGQRDYAKTRQLYRRRLRSLLQSRSLHQTYDGALRRDCKSWLHSWESTVDLYQVALRAAVHPAARVTAEVRLRVLPPFSEVVLALVDPRVVLTLAASAVLTQGD